METTSASPGPDRASIPPGQWQSNPPRSPTAGIGNTGPADAAVELFMRTLAAEVGPRGVRVVGLYTAAVAETLTPERIAEVAGQDVDIAAVLSSVAQKATLRPDACARARGGHGSVPGLGPRRRRDRTIVNVGCGLVSG